MTIYDFLPKFIKRIIAEPAKKTITSEYWNELFNLLVQQGDWGQEAIQLIMTQLTTNVLLKDNTTEFTPTGDYEPATRKFVTDYIVSMGAGDMTKLVYDADDDGIVDNAAKLGGQLPSYYLTADALTALQAEVDAGELNLTNHTALNGTTAVSGHVVLEDNLLRAVHVDGKALSSHQGYVLNAAINTVKNTQLAGKTLWVGPEANKGTDANTLYFCS